MRVRMLVAYDGSGFHGFAAAARPAHRRRRAGEAIERVARRPGRPHLRRAHRPGRARVGSGRVARPAGLRRPRALQRSLVKLCGPAIVVREVGVAAPDFDARFSATGRTYRYTVLNRRCRIRSSRPPRGTSRRRSTSSCSRWRATRSSVSTTSARSAAAPRSPPARSRASLVRRVRRAGWTDLGDDVLRFEIEANAFCHQMVRSIVGTVVAAGHAQVQGRGHPVDPAKPATGRRPPRSRRRRASACGTFRTERSWIRSTHG